jgi:hypothetical protein
MINDLQEKCAHLFDLRSRQALSFKNVKAKPADFPKDDNATPLLYAVGGISK